VLVTLDRALICSGCPGFAGTDTNARFAHADQRKLTSLFNARYAVLDWCEGASCCWIARVFGARTTIVTDHRREVARTGHKIANVFSAVVAVVAHDVFAEILSAHAVYADAGKPIEVAGRCWSVQHWPTPTGTTTAILYGAFVLVGWAHDAYAQWVRARARKTHISNSNIAPHQRTHAQGADN